MSETVHTSILICGVGGQGTILAAKLIAQAALAKGVHVRSAETIGMAQRGGSVVSHVRLGSNMYSPLIPHRGADVLIAFEPCEAVRSIAYLREGGVVAVSSKAVQPVSASLSGKAFDAESMISFLKKHASRVMVLDTDSLCVQLGSPKAANTLLLGAAVSSGMLGVTMEDLKAALKVLVKPGFVELNEKALALGAESAE
ncbi:MAG TPA: pyruvate ferredoxin oxidoreductase [Treponema sp.]|nr:pyruvate ferredoxin oxidoreductase [Treponema sp.]